MPAATRLADVVRLRPDTRRHLCPVCKQDARPTAVFHHIEAHLDSLARDVCPGSGEPFRITIAVHDTPDEKLERYAV